MTRGNTRRTLLKTAAFSGVGYWVAGGHSAAESRSPNEKLNVACVGVGGQGMMACAHPHFGGDEPALLPKERFADVNLPESRIPKNPRGHHADWLWCIRNGGQPVSNLDEFGGYMGEIARLGHNPHVFWDAKILRFYQDGIQFALGDLQANMRPSAGVGIEPPATVAPAVEPKPKK